MCGIAGYISKNDLIGNSEIDSMRILLERMKYRGPDNGLCWNDETVLLGHRRLSIIDLSASGNQPFHDSIHDIHMVFNGEIYNYKELREQLNKQGYVFKSNSDTEVIIFCYNLYGIDFVKYLRGMFAFVLYDKHNKHILFVRDRIGKKPLYLYRDEDKIIFCSELKYFHIFNNTKLEINYESVANYFTFQYIPGISTIYKEVQSIAPGEMIVVDAQTWKEKKYNYWELSNFALNKSIYSIEEIDSLIRESVRYRLIADVEIGILLSGGIDSTLIATYVNELNGHSTKAYSVNFKDKKLDESVYSKLVAKTLGMDLISINGDEINSEVFESCIYHADQPIGDPAIIPTFMISKAISQYVKVVLSGEGADELFNGYHYYKQEKVLQNFEKIIPPKLLNNIFRLYKEESFSNLFRVLSRLKKIYEWRLPIGAGRWTTVYDETALSKLMSPQIVKDAREEYQKNISSLFYKLTQSIDIYDASIFIEMLGWLPDDLLVKVDRMTMAHSVEARAPFLDQKLLESIIGIDSKYLRNKNPLRELLKKKLPSFVSGQIATRKKHGFEVPTVAWLKVNLRDIAEFSFSSYNLKDIEGINPEETALVWKEFLHSPRPELFARKVWLLFCFISWHRQHKQKFGFYKLFNLYK
ncbi:MAG: asparagine synthase (glutamine-hydrolyzing) [Ignavibacteriaceae bacterium]